LILSHNGHKVKSLKEDKYQSDLNKNLESLKKNIKNKLIDLNKLKLSIKLKEEDLKTNVKAEKSNIKILQDSLTNNKNYDFILKTIRNNCGDQLKLLGDINDKIDNKLQLSYNSSILIKNHIDKISNI